jgi:NADH-quinone oxidoreductase subunit C
LGYNQRHMVTAARSIEELSEALTSVCGALLSEKVSELGDLTVRVSSGNIGEVLRLCKEDPRLLFNLLVDITAVDWMDQRQERFEVVYQLLSLSTRSRLTIKASLPENKPEIATATNLWSGANFLEREIWDMFGISFVGHPDLRRVLMYEEFIGHPLRKDYPLQGKQPRVPLRAPEVENTARNMLRPDLVTIRGRRAGGESTGTKAV